MNNLILLWHRKDLRINDNLALYEANKKSKKIVGVFCLDTNILNRDDIAPARIEYMLGCLDELRKKLPRKGRKFSNI